MPVGVEATADTTTVGYLSHDSEAEANAAFGMVWPARACIRFGVSRRRGAWAAMTSKDT
ncbi:hypothetical protein [Catellatospora sichuanensis]|uniref:hypothetical protein n=1 Tax=Catellatospora sichuanensis TaxID=1969805 RepID=UPI001642BAA0|nr:hypothetical protein [Catellatospora sichuanensis]